MLFPWWYFDDQSLLELQPRVLPDFATELKSYQYFFEFHLSADFEEYESLRTNFSISFQSETRVIRGGSLAC